MRKIALLLAGLICSLSAHAELITFEYTGIINTLRETTNGHSRAVVSSNLVRGGARVGDAYHGTFSLDTGVSRMDGASLDNATYSDWAGTTPDHPNKFVLDKTDVSLTSQTIPTVTVTNGSYDSLSINFGSVPDSTSYASFGLSFFDETGTALPGLGIPTNFDLNAWYYAQASVFWFASDFSRYVLMEGMLTSITRVSAVPEPTSYALFFAGIALVSGVAARKRKQAV